MRRMRFAALPVAGLLLAALQCSNVRAEVRVEGEAQDVRLEARAATIDEILAALGERFALHYRGISGGDRAVTANFEGPLRRVVARVLEGYNFVIRERGEGLDVTVLTASSPKAVPAPFYAPPTYPAAKLRRDE